MKRVAVLLGGVSAEREVSLSSGAAVTRALREAGMAAEPIDVGADLGALLASLAKLKPDAVFNALHGRFGEDGTIQGVLDWLGLPYTHSGVRASATAMDKVAARGVFAAAGLPVADAVEVTPAALEANDPLPRPYVVKPVAEGSSVGVHILRDGDNRRGEIARSWRFGERILAERFIPGRELTVAVMDGRPLAVTDIVAAQGFYDYEAKYADGGSRHIVPAILDAATATAAMEIAARAHAALGCRGVSRADFRYDEDRAELILLEVNTQPGMTATSLVPEQAAYCGIAFPDLCAWMVERARHGP